MSIHEDEYPIKDLQLSEVWMAICRGWCKHCQRCCKTHRKNAGIKLKYEAAYRVVGSFEGP